MIYEPIIYKGSYKARQIKANRDECSVYIEQHFNGVVNPEVNYACVVVGSNASALSIALADKYLHYLNSYLKIPRAKENNGIIIGGFNGRGNNNLIHTKMPAILLEPLFITNQIVAKLDCDNYLYTLATCIIHSIDDVLPYAGKIGLSIGHKYKSIWSTDKGVKGYNGKYESDYAEKVINQFILICQDRQGSFQKC